MTSTVGSNTVVSLCVVARYLSPRPIDLPIRVTHRLRSAGNHIARGTDGSILGGRVAAGLYLALPSESTRTECSHSVCAADSRRSRRINAVDSQPTHTSLAVAGRPCGSAWRRGCCTDAGAPSTSGPHLPLSECDDGGQGSLLVVVPGELPVHGPSTARCTA